MTLPRNRRGVPQRPVERHAPERRLKPSSSIEHDNVSLHPSERRSLPRRNRQMMDSLDENPRILKNRIERTDPDDNHMIADAQPEELDFGDGDVVDLDDLIDDRETPQYDGGFDDIDENPVPDDIDDELQYDEDELPDDYDDTQESSAGMPATDSNIPSAPIPAMGMSAMPKPPAPSMKSDAGVLTPDDNDESNENAENEDEPAIIGTSGDLKSLFASFMAKIRSEIGDNAKNDDDDHDDADEQQDENYNPDDNKKNDGKNPDDENNDDEKKDKPSVDKSHGIPNLIISVLMLPFRLILFAFNTATTIIRIAMSAISVLMVFIIIWLIMNVPSALNNTQPSFDTDEGTLTAENIDYNDGKLTFNAVNDSDMIAHAGITAEVKTWKPFAKLPASLFAPESSGSCSSTYVDMNPNDSKQITLECKDVTGFWERPVIHITGE